MKRDSLTSAFGGAVSRSVLVGGILLAGAVHASAASIISPTAVINNTLGQTILGPGDYVTGNIIDQSGLLDAAFNPTGFTSGVTDFATFDPGSVHHTNVAPTQWLGADPPINIPGGVIDFDLGGLWHITRLAYWMSNFLNGMNAFELLISSVSDFSVATSLGNYNVAHNQSTGQVVDITDGTGRYVRFIHNSHHGNRTGMAEIAFDASPATVVPLPAAVPLFVTGLGVLGLLGWRRGAAA